MFIMYISVWARSRVRGTKFSTFHTIVKNGTVLKISVVVVLFFWNGAPLRLILTSLVLLLQVKQVKWCTIHKTKPILGHKSMNGAPFSNLSLLLSKFLIFKWFFCLKIAHHPEISI